MEEFGNGEEEMNRAEGEKEESQGADGGNKWKGREDEVCWRVWAGREERTWRGGDNRRMRAEQRFMGDDKRESGEIEEEMRKLEKEGSGGGKPEGGNAKDREAGEKEDGRCRS
ncbi:unnamed protein product [Pleuronectes platessa]|uniref:Uncharacterized protein n=1 Tax=Pleuronectes platessa TaxID=8262 RepID=A0A9N7UC31_PLEPL|nr:unnamed protein product [Pleuronectes platessa]